MPKFLDLTNRQFGKLKVIERAENKGRRTMWLCECKCSNKKVIPSESLTRGHSKSCGCSSYDNRKSANFKDLTGEKFTYLTVLKRVENTKDGRAVFLCECVCGEKVKATGKSLSTGSTKSCGCFRKETTKQLASTHGLSKTRLYGIWATMKQRCSNPNVVGYKYYGGRGIKVCEEWEDYINFYNWALENGYDDQLSIERIDVNGNYEPFNCTWITLEEQSKNKTSSVFVEYNGEEKIMSDWARYFGVTHAAVQYHLSKGDIETTFSKWENQMQKLELNI